MQELKPWTSHMFETKSDGYLKLWLCNNIKELRMPLAKKDVNPDYVMEAKGVDYFCKPTVHDNQCKNAKRWVDLVDHCSLTNVALSNQCCCLVLRKNTVAL